MAKIKFSALASSIKGVLGGTIFQGWGTLNILRNRTSGVRHISDQTQAQKSILSHMSRAWSGLTDANRATWEAAAQSITVPDAFGNPRHPSGYELFVQRNAEIITAGGSGPLANYPPITDPDNPDCQWIWVDVTVGWVYQCPWDNVGLANLRGLLYITPPVPLGRKLEKGKLTLAAIIDPNVGAVCNPATGICTTTTPILNYQCEKFGGHLTGSKQFSKFYVVDISNGITTVPAYQTIPVNEELVPTCPV